MGNIDFSNNSMFSWYCVMLAVSGLLALGASFTPRLAVRLRVLSALVGVGVFGYAYYLVYVFHGGTYIVSLKIFFLPVFLAGGAIRALAMRRDAKLAPKRRAAREEQWDAEQDWYARRNAQTAQAQAAPPATEAAAEGTSTD